MHFLSCLASGLVMLVNSLLQGCMNARRAGEGTPGKHRVKSCASRGEAAIWAVLEGSPNLSAPRRPARHLKEGRELRTLRIQVKY